MEVIAVDVPELGNRSYLVHDTDSAIVIDPSRRIQELINLAAKLGVNIKAVFETHIHNDYVTGGHALARRLGIPYYISAYDNVEFEHQAIKPDEKVIIGTLQITALSSPGHTSHHLSYLVEQSNVTPALFSGGSLLYGAVGRPDLESDRLTPKLAKAQYQTAQFFVDRLDASTLLYPTHGFVSFCAAAETEHVAVSTIKQQLKSNSVYTKKDEASFVKDLIDGLDVYPSYYAYMAPANLKGPLDTALDPPKLLTKEALLREIHIGTAIIDMRSRKAYATEHMSGTYNIELNTDLATYIGWLLSWDAPLILVGTSTKDVSIAQERLSLIGRDIIAGQMRTTELLKSGIKKSSYRVKSFADLKRNISNENVLVLDVRRVSEWQKGHIPNALHLPLHQLINRLNVINSDKEIWVHCASGYRASIAASIISGRGKKVVLIDDNYSNAVKIGLVPMMKKKFVDEVNEGKAQLLDVRNNAEWAVERAIGAIHIPVGRLLDGDIGTLRKNQLVYVYCESGRRSGLAKNFLDNAGFKVVNIGGLNDWTQAGGAIE